MIQANQAIAPWSTLKKVIFRLCFLFFTLFVFFDPNGFFPFVQDAYDLYIRPFHLFIPWVGKHILHLSYPVTSFTNGSGDTTYDYLILLMVVVLSFFGCIIWTVIDRKRSDYHRLQYWLNVLVRYYFGFTMLNYGMAKLFKLQFPFPSPYGLMETYGNSSPMHLAWSFLGYSKGYNYFMGFAEVSSGVLLMFRRTIRVGAIISLVVAANIMAINYSFDVCVKLLSTVLVVMAIYLLAQGWEHHFNFFFLNRDVRPESLTKPVFRKRWINLTLLITKYVVIAYLFFGGLYYGARAAKQYGPDAPKPPLYGVYNVQTFIRNQDTLPPLTTDTIRWRRLFLSNSGRTGLQLMNDSVGIYTNTPDTVKKRVLVTSSSDTSKKADLLYSFVGKDGLLLTGKWQGDSIRVTLKKLDLENLLLVNRGFHFINERPLNK